MQLRKRAVDSSEAEVVAKWHVLKERHRDLCYECIAHNVLHLLATCPVSGHELYLKIKPGFAASSELPYESSQSMDKSNDSEVIGHSDEGVQQFREISFFHICSLYGVNDSSFRPSRPSMTKEGTVFAPRGIIKR